MGKTLGDAKVNLYIFGRGAEGGHTHRTMRIYQLPRSCICAASGGRDPMRCRRENVFCHTHCSLRAH